MILHIFLLLFQLHIKRISGETISGCTVNNNNRRITNDKTSVTLSCPNNGYILVRNLTFGVHKISSSSCSYQPGDCTTRTTYIGMECNGLTNCDLDLNPQYLHICSQYSDYMVLDYSCLQGQSLSVCDTRFISTLSNKEHRLFLRSPNYPHEYENSLNCSCHIDAINSQIKFLDFYLEERDEMGICSRDLLQMDNRSYCGSSIDDNGYKSSLLNLESSFQLTFKTNDVITRKGFWLSINSEQPIQVSCNNLLESTSTIVTTTTTTIATTIDYSIPGSFIPLIESSRLNNNNNNNNNNHKRRHALSYILILTIIFVVVLLLSNIILVILCWKQRRTKNTINSKTNSTNQPFVCSVRSSSSSSSSSSMTYGETPVLTSLDIQKQPTLSTRYIFQPNQQQLESTPSTSTTTATGPYDDLNDSGILQRPFSKEKVFDNHLLYLQNRQKLSSPNTTYNRMIHFPPIPIRCNFSTPVQMFYPPQPLFDSQHIYETIQDSHCPYQRLAATLRRQQKSPCTCYCEHDEQRNSRTIHNNEHFNIISNPETLV